MLTPPAELNTKVNSILEETATTTNVTKMNNTKPSTNTNRIHLVDETNDVSVETQKPPTQVIPVTRDTVEPPISESEYLERETATGPAARINQLGGVWSSLKAYNRR
jgi:hypothetical protein